MFVRLALALGAIVGTMAVMALAPGKASASELLRRAGKHLALRVSTGDAALARVNEVSYMPAGDEAVRASLPVIEAELARYPSAVFARAHFERLVIARWVKINERPVGGAACLNEGTVILGIGGPGGVDEAWLRRSVHHEVFHMMDRAITATVDDSWAWNGLNAHGFEYVGLESYPSAPDQGFVSGYSMSAGNEDRAEIFSYLMNDPKLVALRASMDGIVRAKVDCLVRVVRERYPELRDVVPNP
ncbi:MAG TPA: putative zinc-binding metallopeptidase [Planctomycetota bacterium]|nr:putative zinc-binding metallopeptidase [Planctomycetota bacterium]